MAEGLTYIIAGALLGSWFTGLILLLCLYILQDWKEPRK